MSASDRPDAKRSGLVGYALLIVLLGVTFHLDVRERDVFSWMDPDQYYSFALGVLEGREPLTGFEVPSIFPFFVMPALWIAPSVPGALWTNFAAALLLLLAIHLICREIGVGVSPPLVAFAVLSSPLLLGLSRSLYVEFLLTGVVTLGFWLWLRLLREPAAGRIVPFAVVFGLGVMLKMTFPLFFALPVAGAIVARLVSGRRGEVGPLIAAVVVPSLVVLGLQAAVFPASFGYYLSFGNTAVPIMSLIGPAEWASFESFVYYPRVLATWMLFALSPWLVVAMWLLVRGEAISRWEDLATPVGTLLLWLVGPLLLLVLQPVKEPRHVAPCVVPAVLLVVMGIERVRGDGLRRLLFGAAGVAAVAQAGMVLGGALAAPYYMDRGLRWEALGDVMARSGDGRAYRRTRPGDRLLHWKYDQNVLLDGFPANEALALTWQLFPGVVFDRAVLGGQEAARRSIAFDRFEDLYILEAFNTYNRRSGWDVFHSTIEPDRVIEHADFVLVNDPGGDLDASDVLSRYPGMVRAGTVERRGGRIIVLHARASTRPYRALYAEAFSERGAEPDRSERLVRARDTLQAEALAGDAERVSVVLAQAPELRAADLDLRNIYWIGGYEIIERLARDRVGLGLAR